MGGILSTPKTVAPLASNEASVDLIKAQQEEQRLLYTQELENQAEAEAASEAEAEQQRLLTIREAEAEAERLERDYRAKRGKKDLLFGTATGVAQTTTQAKSRLLLGGV